MKRSFYPPGRSALALSMTAFFSANNTAIAPSEVGADPNTISAGRHFHSTSIAAAA